MKRHQDMGLKLEGALGREAMEAYAARLAARLSVNGRARLAIRQATLPRLDRLGRRAQDLAAQSAALSPAMEWLSENTGWVQACARAAARQSTGRLPARDGCPRVEALARALVAHSDGQVGGERLAQALSAFDQVQGLDMDEIWLAPLALRLALLEAFYTVGLQVARDQAQRLAAEKWVAAGAPVERLKRWPGSAFCERALKLLHQQEAPQARRALEQWLESRAQGSEAVIRRAHQRQALGRMALSNILSSLRGMEGLCWEGEFRRICRTERALCRDPLYPRMDEESRAVLRRQVTLISRRSGLSEWTVARHAVEAAQGGEGAMASCCYYLYDDQGRRALMERLGAGRLHLSAIAPDPAGRWLMGGWGLCALAILGALWSWAGRWYLLPALALLAWCFAMALTGTAVTRLIKPRALLRLELDKLPDDGRALVVIPALLTSPQRARELAEQLETLGALIRDDNVEYLLLGDFQDAPAAHQEGDEAILEAARQAIAGINRRAGERRYHYLHRARHYAASDQRFMGWERKRGALMCLNRLLLGEESLFEAEEDSAPWLRNRFRFVLTLDADTRMLPGTLYALAGTALHPLNQPRQAGGRRKGYALLAPRVELSCGGRLARLLGGEGGVDSYPTQVSNLLQDLCGRGIYGGKGLYHIAAFQQALEGRVPDNALLSHDLLEGAFAGAALVGDVAVYDGFPATLSGYLRRLHRWTRGDWQLLPFILGQNGLDGLSRFLMLDNLARSLCPAAALWTLVLSLWAGWLPGLLCALIYPFLPVLSALPLPSWGAVRRGIAQLALLPALAVTQADAAARALYRMKVSHKNLLEWTPAAEADRQGPGKEQLPGRAAAILMAPALLRTGWAPAALGLALAFAGGVPWLRALEAREPRSRLTGEQIALLGELARRTWHFFHQWVPLEGPGLPPDNVQLDPPVGAARRTSPTNIGLYMVGCLAARELGLIGGETCAARLGRTMDTLEALEKWKGHLYNWYDTASLAPLAPRYVSAVDSGNLAACLLMAAAGVGGELGARMEALARGMDFTALYDGPRKLFHIGYDAMSGRLSQAHYDLLASESRILSYTAIALGQAPEKHWFRLGRPMTGRALVSWSGTLFEYLMPELFLRAPQGSLLGQSAQAVLALEQKAHPQAWGVSESGFYAFDLQMNYQYRAFGLSQLSLRGGSFDQVIAPYSSVLALSVDPAAAARNIQRMEALGWMGEMGLYEAVDMDPARMPEGVDSRVVMSHMAHHQGMILAAVAGALTGDKLRGYFAGRPEMRALSLLLEEKPGPGGRRPRRSRTWEPPQRKPQQRSTRAGRPEAPIPDGHLLYGGGATCFLTARGEGFYRMRGVMANRFREGLFPGEADGLFVHVKVDGQYAPLTQRVQFGEGEIQWACQADRVWVRLAAAVSPEDGALHQQVLLHNQGQRAVQVEVTGCFALALCGQGDMQAHPAFQNLFLWAHAPRPGALLFTRQPRRRGEKGPALLYCLSAPQGADYSYETDLARLAGRDGGLENPASLARQFQGQEGPALNPCAALRARFSLAPGDQCQANLTTLLCPDQDQAHKALEGLSRDGAQRARLLAVTQARAMLDFLSIDQDTHHLLQRAGALLFYPGLKAQSQRGEENAAGRSDGGAPLESRAQGDGGLESRALEEQPSMGVRDLWALGLSGDLPLISAFIGGKDQLSLAREVAQAHEFYRAMGVWCDLVLVNDYGNDYLQPVRDRLRQLVERGHLRELEGKPGGVRLLEGQSLSAAQRRHIASASALCFEGGAGCMNAQLRRLLNPAQGGTGWPGGGSDRPPAGSSRGQGSGEGLWNMGNRGQGGGIRLQGNGAAPARAGENEGQGRPMVLDPLPRGEKRLAFNGWGGFSGNGYAMDLTPGQPTPAAWCNILAAPRFGCLVSERGGLFLWADNSRMNRITPWSGDGLREGFPLELRLEDRQSARYTRLLPATPPVRAEHGQGYTRFQGGGEGLAWSLTLFVEPDGSCLCAHMSLDNRENRPRSLTVRAKCQFLMGEQARDKRFTRIWGQGDMAWAQGSAPGAGYLALAGALWDGEALTLGLDMEAGGNWKGDLLAGWARDARDARRQARQFFGRGGEAALRRTLDSWDQTLGQVEFVLPDPLLSRMLTRFLPYQALAGRVYGRTGLYQPGGAYGFRDQLQDLLCLTPLVPRLTRAHLLACAARQFEAGDVLHWWHEPALGVRTRISDDMLFLPYVTACYVAETGDRAVLEEEAPYLKDAPLPADQEDLYAPMERGDTWASLHQHCLAALRRASATGPKGLPLMGAGDWNDGMNRVGGESVWLGEFLSVTARLYARECCPPGEEREWLLALAEEMLQAVEQSGWNGQWYTRAFFQDGRPMGEAGCAIDVIAQAWAAAAGVAEDRARSAMDQAWAQLADPQLGIIRLLTPPFGGEGPDPGYIAAYPPGVRENGGQYTHGACWGIMGWAALGQGQRAWQALHMLMPYAHADSREGARRYRVEPYVAAGDVYGQPPLAGRGGWTWYTGAAGWMFRTALISLMGYQRRGDQVRLQALLPPQWQQAALRVRVGASRYTLWARRDVTQPQLDGQPLPGGWLTLADDGGEHQALFPLRQEGQARPLQDTL